VSLEFTFECPLPNGLHARPSSHLADVANEFAAECTLTNLRSAAVANAKSVLSMIAADVRLSDPCSVRVSGADEQAACDALRKFVESVLPGCDEALAVLPTDGGSLPRVLLDANVKWHSGLAVSRGIGQGSVVVIGGVALPEGLRCEVAVDSAQEHVKVEVALAAVRSKLETAVARKQSATEAAVLKAHLAILGDVSLAEKLNQQISEGRSAGQAVCDAAEIFTTQLRAAESLYIRERAIDMQDICLQLLEEIYGAKFQQPVVSLAGPSVVVAENLAPRQLLALDRTWLKALVLASAGAMSHTVILARSLGIPTLAGVKDATLVFAPGAEIVVDANRGLIIDEWSAPVQRFYQREWKTLQRRQTALAHFAKATAITVDGKKLEIAANVSSSEELLPAFEQGADGIGVFRTEMLFAGRDSAPSEEEQFAVYAQAARAANGWPVIIRTIDIGGDKPLPYLNLPHEANPFLGYRGVRIYAEHQALLDAQLRATIRASAHGRIQIMVPMISTLSEVRWFKARVAQIQSDLRAEGVEFDSAMPVGIMIEVPSVAFSIDQLCPEVDFFSIGTNDLAQYFFAVDRDNARIANLSNVRHPSFLRLLQQIVSAAQRGGKWIGMCGEMAGDLRQLPLLVGLGLDEISGTASAIPALKAGTAQLSAANCRELLSQAMDRKSVEEVDSLLQCQQAQSAARPLLNTELVLLDGDSECKDEAIREIVDAFYIAARTESPQQVEAAVWKREAVYSTGLGSGFAIPHCKTDAMANSSIGVLKLKQPIEWGSLDGQPVRVVILLAMRESGPNGAHMQVFSKLARKLMHEEFRDAILNATNREALLAHLAGELDIALL
jgi:fructose-specific PTS system IIA-like component